MSLTTGPFTYDVRCFLGIFGLPTYPDLIRSYVVKSVAAWPIYLPKNLTSYMNAPYSEFKLAKSLSKIRYKNCKQFLLCWSIITKSMHNRSFKVLFNAFHSVRITNSPVHMQGWAHNHRMHAFKYGKKEHFAIDFQVLHKKRDKVFRENRLHNIVNPQSTCLVNWPRKTYSLVACVECVVMLSRKKVKRVIKDKSLWTLFGCHDSTLSFAI